MSAEATNGTQVKVQQEEDDEEEEDLFGQDEEEEEEEQKTPAVAVKSEHVELTEESNEAKNPTEQEPAATIGEGAEPVFELDRAPTSPGPETTSADAPTNNLTISAPGMSIPRKSSGSQPSTPVAAQDMEPVVSPASKLGLGPDIIVPSSVNVSLLDGRILESLKLLPSNLINDSLQEYDDAVKQKKHIRNHGAYLFGVLKRYISVHERAGEDGSMGQELTPRVQSRLERLVKDGFCSSEEMNDKVKGKIRMLSEQDALNALDEFAGVDRGSIRNVGSYLMGILNRYMRGDKGKRGSIGGDDRKRDRGRGRSPDRDQGYGADRSPYGPGGRKYDSYRRERSRDDRDPNQPFRQPFSEFGQPQQQQFPRHSQYGPAPVPPPPPPPRPQFGQQAGHLPPPPQQFVQNQGIPPGVRSSFPPQPHMMQPQTMQPQMPVQPNQNQFARPPPHMQPQMQPQMQPHIQPHMQSQMPGGAPGVPPMFVNQGMPGFPAPNPHIAPRHQQPPQQQPPTHQAGAPAWQHPQQVASPDILGIAAKAAQALATSQGFPSPSQPAMGQYQQQPPAPMPGAYQQQPQGQYTSSPPNRRGRATAQMHELPIAVQFAVQNLQVTGQISGPLDDGILGMVKGLPEHLALAAIQRFQTLDKSTMRNTTAYLAGVLRRELKNIPRR